MNKKYNLGFRLIAVFTVKYFYNTIMSTCVSVIPSSCVVLLVFKRYTIFD